jgi:hypothetical protein
MTDKEQSSTLLKIQTISIVGLLLIALGGIIVYGCQRKQESDRLNTIRGVKCGGSTSALLIEAGDLWDEINALRTTTPANSVAPEILAAANQRLKGLTSQHLSAVETFCDSETVKQIIDTVKTKYPGLTRW